MNRIFKFGFALIAVLVAGGQGYGGWGGGYGEPPAVGGTPTSVVNGGTPGTVLATLNAVVGPGFTITLKKGTANVTSLKAGTYKIVVDDKATVHNFHLLGSSGATNVNMTTTLTFKGKKTWTVKFKKGVTYTYKCDPHASMKKTFKAT